jgi:lipopolysaccharide export system permease protein
VITFRYLTTRYLISATLSLVAVCTVYLIVDFADRAKSYTGPGWLTDVLELYSLKAIVETNQLMPAALALGSAIAMSGLRKNGEVTALWALGRGPATFIVPLGIVSGLAGLTLYLGQDSVIAPANLKAEEISALRFQRWGDWEMYHRRQSWFRGDENRFFYLHFPEGEGFTGVTIYEVSPDFHLSRRTDAARIEPLGKGEWRLVDVERRTIAPDGSAIKEEQMPELQLHLTENLDEFRVRSGKPSQVSMKDLPIEIRLRQRLGLPYREWELALYERRAYQATGIPSALLGMALALRPGRRGHLTAAVAEGFGITLLLWATSAISRTLAIAGHMSPLLGGTLPLLLALTLATVALQRMR